MEAFQDDQVLDVLRDIRMLIQISSARRKLNPLSKSGKRGARGSMKFRVERLAWAAGTAGVARDRPAGDPSKE